MSDLQDIDGIGNSVEEQLNDLGIETINDLANTQLETLKEAGVRSADKIHSRALDQGVRIKDGDALEEEKKNTTYITTGMQSLDRILGGGLQGGFLIGISGESKAGKTQLALQCLASAADYDGNAVYIETEPNRFDIDRVKSLAKKKESYKRIFKLNGHNNDSPVDNLKIQYNAYNAVRESFDQLSLLVVDSFIANFRMSDQYSGRSDLPERNRLVANHLQELQSLADHFDCPVLLTLQVQGNPQQYAGDFSIWGPVLMDHAIVHLIHLSHAKGELKEAQLKGHPSEPDNSVTLKVPENAPLEAMD